MEGEARLARDVEAHEGWEGRSGTAAPGVERGGGPDGAERRRWARGSSMADDRAGGA